MAVGPVIGNPDPNRICTSHVQRQNLTICMSIRRLHSANGMVLAKKVEPLGRWDRRPRVERVRTT